MLQRHRRERHKAVGLCRTEFSQFFVLDPDELARQVTLRRVPVGIDAERLDINALGVHRPQLLRPEEQ
jgi:hypothetical protein